MKEEFNQEEVLYIKSCMENGCRGLNEETDSSFIKTQKSIIEKC